MKALGLLGLCTLLASGCFDGTTSGPNLEGPGETRTSSSTATQTSLPDPDFPLTPIANRSVAFSDCSWFHLGMPLPPATNPGSRPPGWEPADGTTLFGGIGVAGMSCSRVALGPFERGPVRMVIESHAGTSFPPACFDGLAGIGTRGVVATFWIDDAEIAQYLNLTYGLPVIVASVGIATEDVGDVQREVWTWGLAGGEQSAVTVQSLPEYVMQEQTDAYYWGLAGGVVRLHADWEFNGPISGLPSHALYKPPMLSAQVAGGVATSLSGWTPSGDATGEFRVFRDPFCEEPVP